MSTLVTTQEKTRNLFYSVFGWMTVALTLTAGWSYVIASRPDWMHALITKPYLGLTVFIAQLVVVITFSALLPRLSYPTALMLFIAYAILSGTTLSFIFTRFSIPSIIQTLFITGGMFASAGLYGYVTKSDLSQLRSVLFMALFAGCLEVVFMNRSFFFIFFVNIMKSTGSMAADTISGFLRTQHHSLTVDRAVIRFNCRQAHI